MNIRRQTILTLCVSAMVLAGPLQAAARELYRYVNEEGNTVIDYQVPTEYIGNGYEILNREGVVLQVVPRELTEEEREHWSSREEREAAMAAEAERLRRWDESLLLRYSSILDIEAARDRALKDLRIRLSILRGNKRSLKRQVEGYQSQAAGQERAGRSVDQALVTTIEELQGQIAAANRSIDDREREIDIVAAAYQKDILRFEQLAEMVELRRTLSAN